MAGLVSRKTARVLVSLMMGALAVIDVIVFRHYRVPLDEQVIETAWFAWSDVKPVAVAMLPAALPIIGLAGAIEYGLLSLGRSRARVRARKLLLVLWVIALSLGGKLRDGTLEVRLAHAASLTWEPWEPSNGASATAVPVPPLASRRARLPNVLFILTESVRADDDCSNYDPACKSSPRIGALLEHRVPLRQMRSVASYTAVSVSALLTGRPQLGARSEILATPTWFDWIKAVRAERDQGAERAPSVIYWSGQSARVIERADLPSMLDSFVTMETLLGHAVGDEDDMIDQGVDRLLAEHAIANLPALRAPYFVTLHFGGTHAPYFMDKDDAPFRPWDRAVTWSHMPLLHNAYRNAIFEQDKSIARCITAFLQAQGDAPWMIVFTSDHGESFGERGAIHHGQNLYDEQTRVPGWIAFGNGALEPAEEQQLRAHENEVVTHLDLLPTLLDAYGVLDTMAMTLSSRGRDKLAGRSLLRAEEGPRAPLPMTNCTAMFPCPVNTWGMLGTERLLVAQPWDSAFRCMDVRTGIEIGGADDASCRHLVEASRPYFPKLPNGALNR